MARTHILKFNQMSIPICLKAEEIGPITKIWSGVLEIIYLKLFMMKDTKWKFVNVPSLDIFRLWENTAGYYAGKQSIKSGHLTS